MCESNLTLLRPFINATYVTINQSIDLSINATPAINHQFQSEIPYFTSLARELIFSSLLLSLTRRCRNITLTLVLPPTPRHRPTTHSDIFYVTAGRYPLIAG